METAKSIQLASRRYVAPYQHSQAPQPKEQQGAGARIAVAMFTGGAPAEATKEAARDVLADLLGIEQNQRVIEGEARELNAEELNAEGDDDA